MARLGRSCGVTPATLGCLALLCFLSGAVSIHNDAAGNNNHGHREKRLAVLLPTYNPSRDAAQWSTRCSAGTTMAHDVDLVFYVLSAEDNKETASPNAEGRDYTLSEDAGRCFARVRTAHHVDDGEVLGGSSKQESAAGGGSQDIDGRLKVNKNNKQAKPSSEMLYSAFLENDVRSQLSEYDALAVIPGWDSDDTATDIYVDALYDLAFRPAEKNFWVKTLTSRRQPKSFSGAAPVGGVFVTREDAAIYNNNDEELVDYIRVTHEYQQQSQRQESSLWGTKFSPRSFGAALSLTLKHPLHKSYASKFVAADLDSMSTGRGEEPKPTQIGEARELGVTSSNKWNNPGGYMPTTYSNNKWGHGDTRGSKGKGGSQPKWQREEKWKGDPKNGVQPKWQREEKWKTHRCLSGCTSTSRDGTKGRVCDTTCAKGEPYGTHGCSAKNGMYGLFCRVCYNDITKALKNDSPDNRAIMCDTMAPPSSYTYSPKWQREEKWNNPRCLADCTFTSQDGTKGRVCDTTCATGEPYGTHGCSAKNGMYGLFCRVCYNDITKALKNDSPDNRAIMCDTMAPPSSYTYSPKWQREEKWKGDPKNGVQPKWQREEKWKTHRCLSGCTSTSRDGSKGRVCDTTCAKGEPYGTHGCSAKNGMYGLFCRVCYNDITKALKNDSPDDRAIMCDTMAPPSSYTYSAKHLAYKGDKHGESSSKWGGTFKSFKSEESVSDSQPRRRLGMTSSNKWNNPGGNMPTTYSNNKWGHDGTRGSKGNGGSQPKWQREERWKTHRCLADCTFTSRDGTKGRVCDTTCATGEPYGTHGCLAKNGMYGLFCRVCYNDITKALKNDSPDNRAIMCDTMAPPSSYTYSPKWQREEKWKGDPKNGVQPKWQREEKWKTHRCLSGCTSTSRDGTKGRVCDTTCAKGEPYGTHGCSAKNGMYGLFCRVCYNDITKALKNDSPDDRAIMCDTMAPPSSYTNSAKHLAYKDDKHGDSSSKWGSTFNSFKSDD